MPTCGSASRPGCGAPILWVTMRESGKPMPCDPDLLTDWLVPTDEGWPRPAGAKHVVLISPEGETLKGWAATPLTEGSRSVQGYVPHFATCPKATHFRRGAP